MHCASILSSAAEPVVCADGDDTGVGAVAGGGGGGGGDDAEAGVWAGGLLATALPDTGTTKEPDKPDAKTPPEAAVVGAAVVAGAAGAAVGAGGAVVGAGGAIATAGGATAVDAAAAVGLAAGVVVFLEELLVLLVRVDEGLAYAEHFFLSSSLGEPDCV